MLCSLSVFNFRNLQDTTVALAPGLTCISGENAQGKTALVEAVGFLCQTRSFRTSKVAECIRWGEPAASVFGKQQHHVRGEESLGVSIEGSKRKYFINGKALRSASEFFGKIPGVVFTPQELALVQGAPLERRSFLDLYLSQLMPAHASNLNDYARALKSKNALLRGSRVAPEELTPWNTILAERGAEIFFARQKFLGEFQQFVGRVHRELFAVDGELSLQIESRLQKELEGGGAQQALVFLEAAASKEIAAEGALYGVHRDDLAICLNQKEARSYASQGQTRSIVLSLLLGVIDLLSERIGSPPVVVLDDVAAELDLQRSERFFGSLLERQGQILVTGTDLSVKPLRSVKSAQQLVVKNGEISAC